MRDNLALNKFAVQSSTYNHKGVDLRASLAVDGYLDTDTGVGMSCTHTEFGVNPWWGVDLGSQKSVREVYIVNRGDCCGERLSSFEIRVGKFLGYLYILLG